jgi:hypothetical protein
LTATRGSTCLIVDATPSGIKPFLKVVFMKPGKRLGLSAEQKLDVWRRWKAGQTLHEIGRAFGKEHSGSRNFNPGAVQFSMRSVQMAHAPHAEHFELEEGHKYFYGIRTKTNYRKAFPLLLAAARQGYVTPSIWLDMRIETPWERRKTSLIPGSGGQRQRNVATRERCSILRWIMTLREESAAIRERHSSCISEQLS